MEAPHPDRSAFGLPHPKDPVPQRLFYPPFWELVEYSAPDIQVHWLIAMYADNSGEFVVLEEREVLVV